MSRKNNVFNILEENGSKGTMAQLAPLIYDHRKIYAPLYNIIFGVFATKKGDLEPFRHCPSCKQM